jgi:RHS repeat-associated protein
VTTVSAQFANQNGCWTYDAFGNRTMEAYSTLSSTPCAPGANDNAQLTVTAQSSANNNQVAGITQYDPAGEVTYDGSNYYRYDGEGRLCAVDNLATGGLTQYIYDAGGARVAKGSLTSWPASCGAPGTNGFTLTSQYLLDLSGEQVTELNGAGTWQHSNAFEGGRLTATYDQNGLHFAIADPLGTKRVQALITTAGGATLDENCFSLPFGNNIGNSRQTNCQGPGVDATEHHFTGKERDTESGNDYFEARYYSSSMGRFMSPDWSAKAEPVPYAKLDNPQSLNLYAYVGNNPMIRVDADGHDFGEFVKHLANAFQELTGKVTVGLGLEGKVKIGPKAAGVVGRAGGAVKYNLSFSTKKVSDSVSANIGVSLGKGNAKIGLEGATQKTLGSTDLKTGETSGSEPAKSDNTVVFSKGNDSGNGSDGGFSLGAEYGEGLLGGMELSITKEGVNELKEAGKELVSTVKDAIGSQ